ncbi:DUF882 domain-containing protein [Microvirga sp. 2MCAF38]|uniref:DUF882 domain-containing protein n=1 Tax=Microvirga sp. 2MCAF38 TaxID=3232989 RepID=UPI003F9B8ED7
MRSGRQAAASNFARRAGIGLAALVTLLVGGTRGTQDAIANGDTRTLTFYHNNTKENLTVTFRRNGQYDSAALEQLNWFLRDWRREESIRMDPRLFDTVWEVYREVGSSAPVHVNSAYRSPNTNAMLRRRSSAVAKNSQHMLGKAMDFYLPDASTERLRAIGMRLQNGGVGYYPNAYTPFVHLDVGSVRAWPRMSRDQLARIFPDGKTVHIPSDGTPMARYEEARADVLSKGGTVAGYTAYAEAEEGGVAPTRRKSLWASLFGGSDEDEDAEEIRTASRPGRALLASRNAPDKNSYMNDSNGSVTSVLMAYNNASSAPQQPAPRAAPVQVARQEPDEQAIRSAGAAFRDEPASPPPLPPVAPTRIAGLPSTIDTPTGPTLAWQQGASGQNPNGSDMKIGREVAFAPMPPRRPDDVSASTTILAYAPMPPVRPSALVASNPIPGLPEARGTVDVAATASINHPLPPPRPGTHNITVASAVPIELPSGVAKANPALAQKGKPTTNPSPLIASPSLHMSFSSKPMGDLATNRFTGPAVKPLPVVR